MRQRNSIQELQITWDISYQSNGGKQWHRRATQVRCKEGSIFRSELRNGENIDLQVRIQVKINRIEVSEQLHSRKFDAVIVELVSSFNDKAESFLKQCDEIQAISVSFKAQIFRSKNG
eukprot:TRINITY_DN579_c0_g2_i7.p1 TRINITY_DN579_c0_g2~~TRINITY_DN579_c0_g2_i7.p1  ORF type:complete len:118 (-),score=18.25 TRINITY_DN579_c0_g2_i7:1614-1967(-)